MPCMKRHYPEDFRRVMNEQEWRRQRPFIILPASPKVQKNG